MEKEKRGRIKRVLLCVGGGFQAYAIPGFVLSLLKHVADDVQVVLSRTAAKLTSPYAIEVASRHAVFVDVADRAEGIYVPHIELAIACDLIIVYPATVSTMSKVAQGIADDLISAIILATERPVFFVPVTNDAMWRHPAVQRNVQALRDDGYEIQPMIADVEVATREGLSEAAAEFPFPTLLPKIFAASASSSPMGRARRKRDDA